MKQNVSLDLQLDSVLKITQFLSESFLQKTEEINEGQTSNFLVVMQDLVEKLQSILQQNA